MRLSHPWETQSFGLLLFLLRMKIGDELKKEGRKTKLERSATLRRPHQLPEARLGGSRFPSPLPSSSTHLYQIRILAAVAEQREAAIQQTEAHLLHNEEQSLPTKPTVLNQLQTANRSNARDNTFRGVRRHQRTNEEQAMNQLPRESHGRLHNSVEAEMLLKARINLRRNPYPAIGPMGKLPMHNPVRVHDIRFHRNLGKVDLGTHFLPIRPKS